jgi:hypothetical protein
MVQVGAWYKLAQPVFNLSRTAIPSTKLIDSDLGQIYTLEGGGGGCKCGSGEAKSRLRQFAPYAKWP